MFCPKCGMEVVDGAAFCPNCGFAFPNDVITPNASKSEDQSASQQQDQESKKQFGKFQWKDKYKIPAIIIAVVLAVGIGLIVRLTKSEPEVSMPPEDPTGSGPVEGEEPGEPEEPATHYYNASSEDGYTVIIDDLEEHITADAVKRLANQACRKSEELECSIIAVIYDEVPYDEAQAYAKNYFDSESDSEDGFVIIIGADNQVCDIYASGRAEGGFSEDTKIGTIDAALFSFGKGEYEAGIHGIIEDLYIADESDSTAIHQYTYVVEDCTWTEAFNEAKSAGGHLARIDSYEEYEYILEEIAGYGYDKVQFKLGARRDSDSSEYYWVDDDNNTYGDIINSSDYWASSIWLPGEPSYSDGDVEEAYLTMYYNKNESRWVWNDAPNDILSVVPSYEGRLGYIIEWED